MEAPTRLVAKAEARIASRCLASSPGHPTACDPISVSPPTDRGCSTYLRRISRCRANSPRCPSHTRDGMAPTPAGLEAGRAYADAARNRCDGRSAWSGRSALLPRASERGAGRAFRIAPSVVIADARGRRRGRGQSAGPHRLVPRWRGRSTLRHRLHSPTPILRAARAFLSTGDSEARCGDASSCVRPSARSRDQVEAKAAEKVGTASRRGPPFYPLNLQRAGPKTRWRMWGGGGGVAARPTGGGVPRSTKRHRCPPDRISPQRHP